MKLLTAKQVAEKLSMHEKTVQRMFRSGRLPTVDISPSANAKRKTLRMRDVDLDAFMNNTVQKNRPADVIPLRRRRRRRRML